MLGLGGLIGADAGVPTMVLMRAPLGRRGSYLPTGLNILQCFGWSVFELIVIATGASALSQQVFGFGGTDFWKILFGAFATVLALLGPVGFVRRYVRKFEVWIVIASLLYLSWWSLHGQHVEALWGRPGSQAFWPGFDLVIASVISWTPLVADYTRFSTTRAAGFWGAGFGYFVPTIPLFALGAVIAMSRNISDASGLLTAIAAGGAASVLALLALTVDESDEAFANVYSGAVSLQNLIPNAPQRLLVAGTAAVATAGALAVDLRNYQPFLYLLGSFFVPLFGVLLADWLLAGCRYRREDVFAAPALSLRAARAPGSPGSASTSGSTRRGRAGGRASSRTPTRTPFRSAEPRCRASRSPSGSPPWPGSSPAGRRRCRRTRDRAARQPLARRRRRRGPPGRRPLPRRPRAPAPRRARGPLRALRRPTTAPSSCRRSRGSGRRCATSPARRRRASRSPTRASGG